MVQGVKMGNHEPPDSVGTVKEERLNGTRKASHSLTTIQDDKLNWYMCRVGKIGFVYAWYCRLLVVMMDWLVQNRVPAQHLFTDYFLELRFLV